MEQSGYEQFVANLNSFVASRGVLSKVQAPLETLKNAITNVIGKSEELSVDRDIEAAEELLRRRQRTLRDGKRQVDAAIDEIVATLCSKIKTEGSNAASTIVEGITKDEAERNVKDAQAKAETYIADYEKQICNRISAICENVDQELSLINGSAFAKNVQVNLSNHTSTRDENKLPSFDEGGFVKNIAFNTKDAAKTTFLGQNASGLIKDVGHFFDYKFAPWEAVKYAKYLGWVAAAATIFMTIRDFLNADEKRKEAEDNLRKAREQIQANFNEVAENVHGELTASAKEKMSELIDPALKDADDTLAEFKRKKVRLQALGHSLQSVLGEVNRLMSEVQQTAKA